MTYLKSYQNKPKARGRKPVASPGENTIRLDQRDHLIIPIPGDKRRRYMGANCSSIIKLSAKSVI